MTTYPRTTDYILIDCHPTAHECRGDNLDCTQCELPYSEHEWLGMLTCSNTSGRGIKGEIGRMMRAEYKANNELMGL